ncbi:DUF2252 domain-containing protein [Epidermidibacterium keratini]|uniref:DUF2252 domain-containing protein n=1 Tax=Epidermidibacterium keratini TaxID=1891644 RepID=A0A7L4YM10_9ACTN|nr:DUF2252 domain-containing protein [Epidermidibacterium keratini]QHB99863.1 DUF2252 domain-containing protein [Epidermidibacterium keratini]
MQSTLSKADTARSKKIVKVLDDAFAPLIRKAPAAFRTKFRKMASDPHSFYRGSAALFFADMTTREDPFANAEARRIWIHGDLHVENFGTYLNSSGLMVFDVNDFDEAYLGNFTWDLQRFVASLALVGWQKALPEHEIRRLIGRYVRSYLAQVDVYADVENDEDFALRIDNTSGAVNDALRAARARRRADLLVQATEEQDGQRVFRDGPGVRRLGAKERAKVVSAFERYLGTIPEDKRYDRALFYELHDIVGRSGFGIGSAGLPAYSLLVEGYNQALDNDVVLSMKQANVPALSRFVDRKTVESYFENEGHRTMVSQRALQVHTDPLLGYTEIDGTGFVVSEVSPYEVDLDWDNLTEPDDIAEVVDYLGRATAKIHCASDEDSDQDLVEFQVEDAIVASVRGRRREFITWLQDFGVEYADTVHTDYALFVDAFRENKIGVSAI